MQQKQKMQLGWVDFTSADREKVFDVMNLLQEPGAVDEIGIGQVRDAFSNLFFPGTSTVQTIAKYFLIVPYVLKEAVDGRYGSDLFRILQRIDVEEKQCGLLLMQHCPGETGIIGQRVLPRGWVVRRPSNIYWNGICTYGICTRTGLSIPDIIRTSLLLQTQKKAAFLGNRGDDQAQSDRDDIDAGKDVAINLFSVPDDYYGDWRETLSTSLTSREAAFLRRMIQTHTQTSLLCYLLEHNIDVKRYESFEAVYEDLYEGVPPDMQRMMKLACEFNRLVYSARVRYNFILSDGQNKDASEEWDYIAANKDHMFAVDVDDVLSGLHIVNPRLRRFLASFKEAVLTSNLEAADIIIINREIEIKGRNRSKLCKRNDYPNDNWIGERYLDFRFSSAKRIITDIYRGEVADHV